ncbi:MAG: hypothetical protein AAGE43_08940 [Pseudomonadota bacterium]
MDRFIQIAAGLALISLLWSTWAEASPGPGTETLGFMFIMLAVLLATMGAALDRGGRPPARRSRGQQPDLAPAYVPADRTR